MLNKKACREFAAPGVAMSMDSGLLHAEQVKYIIQTAIRIISHRKTLVLYIHDREHAAQGDFRPIWTMFHSKDGYITLAGNENGKTSWRTASFDNLGKDWRFVRYCAFYSPEDQERLERYFHDGINKGFDALIQAQADMKAQRLEKRLEIRRQKVQNRMACVPPLPHGWRSWAYQTLPAYFFYDYKKQKSAKGICTNCGHEVTLSGARHNAKGTCPHCKRELTLKSRGRRGWIENRDTCQIIQKTAPDEIVIRIIKTNCYYIGDIPRREAYENARLFIQFDKNGPTHWEEYYYNYLEKHWKPGARPVYSHWCYYYEADICGHVYCRNLPKVFENTPWRYCPLTEFYRHFQRPMAVIPFLAAFLNQPRLEHLVKVGFFSLARDLVRDHDFQRGIPLDQTQDRTHRILQVRAEDVDFLRGLDADFDMLKTYQEYCWENLKDRQELLSWQLKHSIKRDVLETLDYMTVHKMTRYLEKQYPLLKDRKTPAGTPRYQDMQDLLSEYRDYLDMCNGQNYNMRSSFVLYPRDLQKSHDKAAQNIKAQKDENIQRGFQSAYARVGNSLDFEYKGLKIVRPNTPDEIIREGNVLHHCVGAYVKRIAQKKCLILFLRRCKYEAKPFYTIEVRHRRIVQVRGQGNQDPVPEVQNFIDHWKREVLQAVVYEAA